ncbi:tRNA lysidine(34) synthetase TilS [Limibacillus halophilus]
MSAGRAGPTQTPSSLEIRFAEALEGLLGAERPDLAVALSGGGDSLALAALLAAWGRAKELRILALTVDHGLRPGSREEALRAGQAARLLGLEHRLLTWRPEEAVRKGLQAKARAARYSLLAEACREEGITHLCLAHNLEDQAETFLLRLEARSDLPGLACMAARSRRGDLTLLRPLLGESGQALRSWLAGHGLSWSEDPSNRDRRFSRVRLRALLPSLEEEGVTASLLAGTANALGRLRARLDRHVAERIEAAAVLRPEGYIEADLAALLAPPQEIAGWALSRCLRSVGGLAYPPRRERLERLLAALARGDFRSATLGGCHLLRRGRQLLVLREAAALPAEREVAQPGRRDWDGRFLLEFSDSAIGCRLAALGRKGWRELRAADLSFAEDVKANRAAPLEALQALPALWDGAGLAEIPALGWRRADLPRSLCLSSAVKLLIPLKYESFTVALSRRHII